MIMEEMTYKTIRKIDKTKEQLRYNTSWVRSSQLEDKLYKQFKELADEMINSVQYVIAHRGAYENVGWDEERMFMGMVRGCSFNYQQQCNLQEYISKLINNLKY